MSELLGCPFCGGNDARVSRGAPGGFFVWHKCGWGGFASEMFGYRFETEAEAIAAWNRRASLPEAPAVPVVKALERAEKALRPFRNAVFNDNGDMTVDMSSASYDDFCNAYFAHRALEAAIQSSPPVKAAAVDGAGKTISAWVRDILDESRKERPEPSSPLAKNINEICEAIEAFRKSDDAALASQHAVEGEAVAWRWRWADASEDDGWTYTHRRPKSDPALIIEPLYTSHRPAAVSPLPLTGAEP